MYFLKNIIFDNFTDHIHDDYNDNMINSILKRHTKEHILIIIDDFIYDKKQNSSTELMYNGCYHNISLIILMKQAIPIPPTIRGNFDYKFLFKENNISFRKRLYDYYASVIPTFKSFDTIMRTLEINTTILCNDDKVFIFKIQEQNTDLFIKAYKIESIKNDDNSELIELLNKIVDCDESVINYLEKLKK